MKPLFLLACVVLPLTLPSAEAASADRTKTAGPLPRSTPEAQGVSSTALLEFVNAADATLEGLNSFMLVRHGHVIAEGWWSPYNPDSNHELYSLSKSFTSTAVGMAVAEGRLTVDDEVLKLFSADAPAEPGANLKAMRVRDLLSMSTGHQDETSSAPDRVSPKSFLAHPVPHKPGTHFRYNTPATFMLSAIVQQRTGETILDYLRPRLFEPLGISHPTWDTNFQGIALGGYGLRVRTEDIAKFGELYLRKGRWNGRQLIPADWVEAATSRQVSNGSSPTSDWDQGYGYQFWRCRHHAYRGDGAFGQYCLVLPDQDAVVAITSGLKDMQAVLNLVWDRLLPAFQKGRLARNSAADRQLAERLRGLTLRTADGPATSPALTRVAGRTFTFPANDQVLESIAVQAGTEPGDLVLTTTGAGYPARIPCGHHVWRPFRGPFGPYRDEPLAACAAWSGDDTLVVKICAYETPYTLTLKLKFTGDQATLDAESNVGFAATRKPQLVGQSH